MNAPERYLLGELAPAEAEDFELHYFECQHCALAVETGEQFIAGACAYYKEPAIVESRTEVDKPVPSFLQTSFLQTSFLQTMASFWFRPVFAIPVMAALAAVTIYQGAVVIPRMRSVLNTARSLPAVQLISASRGDEPVLKVSPKKDPFAELKADIPPGETYKEYLCVLIRDKHEVSETLTSAPAEGQPITIQVPVAQLRSGRQDLALYGVKSDGQRSDETVSTAPFQVEFY
jgi:Putative zinc-finger